MNTDIRYIFIDLGGTFRVIDEDPAYLSAARAKIAQLCGVEVIKGLHERGYKLGIISNLIGETEVPDWLEEDGLDQYFDSVILSSVCHLRKPGFEIYQLCAKEMGVDLADCVSVADNIKRDIPGAKKAGVGCNIIFESPEKKHAVEFTEENRPDAIIKDFREILDLLPPLN